MPNPKLRRVARMEDGTRKRWEAAWAPFWDAVWRAVPDDVLDAVCYDGPEAEREAHLDRVDGALLRFGEDEPEWPDGEWASEAWAAWTDATFDALDAAHAGDLSVWPHALTEPPPEGTLHPDDRALSRERFARQEPGTTEHVAAAWPLFFYAVLDAVRLARQRPTGRDRSRMFSHADPSSVT